MFVCVIIITNLLCSGSFGSVFSNFTLFPRENIGQSVPSNPATQSKTEQTQESAGELNNATEQHKSSTNSSKIGLYSDKDTQVNFFEIFSNVLDEEKNAKSNIAKADNTTVTNNPLKFSLKTTLNDVELGQNRKAELKLKICIILCLQYLTNFICCIISMTA